MYGFRLSSRAAIASTGNDVPLMGRSTRHDNSPHKRWESVATFPKHFHDGSEMNVSESHLSEVPEEALREFLAFVRANVGASSSIS